MTDSKEPRWRPTRTHLIAGGVVVGGFLLTALSWWFLLLAALGSFGPGLLRELGWMTDKDEFQRGADHRAGYHAFLACGMTAFALVAFFRSGERSIRDLQELATLFLVILWFTWLLSSLLAYWGPERGAAWILRIFGSVLLVFTILSNLGSEWTGWAALILHPLLAAPFFVLAWLSGRRPRVSGAFLLVVSLLFILGVVVPTSRNLGLITQGITFILFIGPLIASGVALLGSRKLAEGGLRNA